MSALLEVTYFKAPGGDPGRRERLFALRSRETFQLEHACRDLGLFVARHHPDTPPGEYPVTVDWRDLVPELTMRLPDGTAVRRRYSQSALRGSELLRTQPPERARDADYYVAAPAADAGVTPRRGRFAVDGGAELKVVVPAFPTASAPLPLEDLLLLGGPYALPTELPVVCSPALLRAVAEQEHALAGGEWRERGAFLLGRVCRDPETRDLVTLIDDTFCPAAHGTVSTLEWTPDARAALTDEIERRRGAGEPHLRSVGWLHTHHLGELRRRGETGEPTPGEAAGTPATSGGAGALRDGRFFSAQDKETQRTFFDAASVGIVLDAPAALAAPDDVGRCFAVYGVARAVVARRGLYLGDPAAVRLRSEA